LQYEDFAISRRQQVERRYFDLLEHYIGKLIEKNSYQIAETYLKRGLDADPLWTNGVRLALDLYTRSERTLYAIKAYRAYEAELAEKLNLTPEQDIRDHFDMLCSA
jgi:DNA-binding SARP family transcriptional activator